MMPYQPMDLFFTRSGSWLSEVIRWATREKGEAKTEASHVGAIITPGFLSNVECVEALTKVERHPLWEKYGGSGQWMTIYRAVNISAPVKRRMARRLRAKVGETYGYGKILLHLLRKLTGDPRWLDLSLLDRYPICSYLVATEFDREGFSFGIDGRKATPDDMLDFCEANPDKWKCVRPWASV